jgi:hypothetical protein
MKTYYTTEDIKDIKNEIENEKEKSRKLKEESAHKDLVSDAHDRQVKRLKVLITFIKSKQIVEWYDEGCLLINHKFVFSTRTNKWRQIGKSIWYKSKSPKDFIEQYLKYDNSYIENEGLNNEK